MKISSSIILVFVVLMSFGTDSFSGTDSVTFVTKFNLSENKKDKDTDADSTTLVRTLSLNENIKDLHKIYADLFVFSDYHPLIILVDCLDSDTGCTDFRVKEQPFNWLPFKTNYRAKVKVLSDTQIVYYISELDPLSATISYSFVPISEKKTDIKIEVSTKGKFMKNYLSRKMMRAQEKVVEGINEKMKE